METTSTGSTWADAARDLIAFARDDTATFLLVLAAIIFSLYLLGPKTMRTLSERMRKAIDAEWQLPLPPSDAPPMSKTSEDAETREEDRR